MNGQGGEIIIQMKGVQMCEVIIDFGLEESRKSLWFYGLEGVVRMNGVKLSLSEEIINFCLDK